MKKNRTKQVTAKILLAILCVSHFVSLTVFAQRDRVVTTASKPTPSPTPKPTLKTKPTPTPTPTPAPSPTPTFTPSPSLVTKSVEELQTRIREVLRRPGLVRSQVGIKVASLDTGRVLFEENADKLYMPASNMKAYTVATALDRLTPDYRFVTRITSSAKPDSNGVIKGDLTIGGGGDPTFAARLNNGDYWKGINEIALRFAMAGVKKIEGNIIGSDTLFKGAPIGFGWEADDLQTYSGASISALTINDNVIDVVVKSGIKEGEPCLITTAPPVPVFQIVNKTVTAPSGMTRRINVTRKPGQNVVEVSGVLAIDDQREYRESVAVENPALAFVYMLRVALAQKGITITGQSLTKNGDSYTDRLIDKARREPSWLKPETTPDQQTVMIGSAINFELAVESAPLSDIAAKTMKPSQNLYTEIILRTLGEVKGEKQDPKDVVLKGQKSSAERGIEVVKGFLKEAGVPEESFEMYDGSGLSRHNLITASGTVQLYTYMSRHKYAKVFYDSLPIGGIDGTLSNRMRNTPAAGNVRAKTGTINQVATLSGYVTTASGEKLVFSVLVNNMPEDSLVRRSYIDEIVVMLASFTGRS